jgi:alpha-amylase/alpha-mannosidase (GH57 family)
MERYICVHGHFYQPPRENAWLESVEAQESAAPYHDWNERITAECYGPNARARILGTGGRLAAVVNNYAHMSFDFGPTLLAWLQAQAPHVYQSVIDADTESRRRFSGHGAAMAQAYSHMILPLANARDQRTQVIWGIRDFTRRFGRAPEGMWLPETAVDLASLEAMAEQGIAFTILAPHQAQRVRRRGGRTWHDVRGGRIDPTLAYRVRLPSGRAIHAFFYDGPISRAVAFEGLLADGGRFARRMLDGFDDRRTWPQMVTVATDGETYGHHHRYGEMALAYALRTLEEGGLCQLTVPGEYLERHPATHDVDIIPDTSWSCAHGLERWRSDCGCRTGRQPGWSQAWRGPLRQALDDLRDALAPRYAAAAAELLHDPWAARDEYIDVVLDRSPDNVDDFFARHARRPLQPEERVRALGLLELQRHAMLMYTSCGWFFDEISGIETVQILQYAARAIDLARGLLDCDLEPALLGTLRQAPSNVPEYRDGAGVYERLVRPARVDLAAVAAHHAISALFLPGQPAEGVYCYGIATRDHRMAESGRARLVVGRAAVTSEITGGSAEMTYGFLHLGDHHVSGGVRPYQGEEGYRAVHEGAVEAFARGDLAEVLRRLDRYFAGRTYSLGSLFRDARRQILDLVFAAALGEAEAAQRHIYEDHAPLMRFVRSLHLPLPGSLQAAAAVTIHLDLERALACALPDRARVQALIEQAEALDLKPDAESLGYVLGRTLAAAAERLLESPADAGRLADLMAVAELAGALPFPVDLWPAQNAYFRLLSTDVAGMRARASGGEAEAAAWLLRFGELGDRLGVEAG